MKIYEVNSHLSQDLGPPPRMMNRMKSPPRGGSPMMMRYPPLDGLLPPHPLHPPPPGDRMGVMDLPPLGGPPPPDPMMMFERRSPPPHMVRNATSRKDSSWFSKQNRPFWTQSCLTHRLEGGVKSLKLAVL